MSTALAVGDKAPDFSIATTQGEASSKSLKGKAYVLYFYPRDDTPGCTKEAIAFSALLDEFAKQGVKILGISKDSVQSHEKFVRKFSLGFPLGSDPETVVAQQFGVWMEKKLYGRVYMGMDRATFLVDGRGFIRKIWRKVKVPGHAEAVLEAARAHLARA
ncbi:MAG: peroxiredoxin [Alphaproteobacteria bacterium]|nr:peroxiredoxin [Alphaproteobacteria bacterium]